MFRYFEDYFGMNISILFEKGLEHSEFLKQGHNDGEF